MYFTVSNELCHMHTIENTVAEVTTSEQKVILVSKNKPVLITTTTLIILVTWQNQTQIKASHQLRSSSVKTRKTGKEIFQIFAEGNSPFPPALQISTESFTYFWFSLL